MYFFRIDDVQGWYARMHLWSNVQIRAFGQALVEDDFRIKTYYCEFIVNCLLVGIINTVNDLLRQLGIQAIEFYKDIFGLLPNVSVGVTYGAFDVAAELVLEFVQQLLGVQLENEQDVL